MPDHDQISRFYGLPITPRMIDASEERLTGPYDGDLVHAHLSANYSYFGAIDKTLAGFFVLDDEGDNYTLLDVRGDGRVWWQDHETRELYDRFDSLEDWVSFKKELDDGADEDELRDAYRTGRPAVRQESPGVPTTETLAGRYQWLVWLLAQPLLDGAGDAIQSDEHLAGNAAGHLRAVWPTDEAAGTALLAELPYLAADPHLAVYWLLHTSLLAMDEQRARVLAAIGPEGGRPPLVEAFAAVFGTLPLDGDVPVVPGFRARRSLALLNSATEREQWARVALLSLRIAPDVRPLTTFRLVHDGLRDGTLTDAEVADAARDMEAASGTFALRALLDQRAGRPGSAHADEFARAVVGTGESWPAVLDAVWVVHPLIRDADALASVARFLLEKEPHHRWVLALAAQAQELAGRELFLPAEQLPRALPWPRRPHRSWRS